MAHLLLIGSWQGAMDLAALLHSEHTVTLAHQPEELDERRDRGFDLMLAEAGFAPAGETARRLGLPWIACSGTPSPAAAGAAYREGALAVLPWDAPAELARNTVSRLLATLGPREAARVAAGRCWQRRYRVGERILLDPESTLEVLEGVVALTVLHADGDEVLLGLYGPGQVLAGHPEDACCIQLQAHTDAVVRLQLWAEAARRPDFAERLRKRLRLMEAWAAMQARPQTEQRLLGILSLLAEQFGRPAQRGTMIEVKVTHAQLASAVGATRTTVTRLLGQLRRRGVLLTVSSAGGERYCLKEWEDSHTRAAG